MAILNIRSLPDHVHKLLRLRAARAGRSMEAEARKILTDTLTRSPLTPDQAQAWVAELYDGAPPSGAVDELIRDRREEAAKE